MKYCKRLQILQTIAIHYIIQPLAKLKEFPPAPENIKPDIEWFSHFQKQIGIRTGAVRCKEVEDVNGIITEVYKNLGTKKTNSTFI